MKRKYIILSILCCMGCLLFVPMFYYDLEISYLNGTQLLEYPLYNIAIILIVLFSLFNHYKYSKYILLGSSLVMMVLEIYYSLTWYIQTIMDFNIIFALGNMKPAFILLLCLNIMIIIMIVFPEKARGRIYFILFLYY